MSLLQKVFVKKKEKPGCMLQKGVQEPLSVYAPAAGNVIRLAEVKDGVFSEGILGKGCAVVPEMETIYAPFQGTIINVSDTKHAVGLKSDDGMEVLIHVGIDTVALNGQGFEMMVAANDTVTCGQPILTFSKKVIEAAGYSDTVIVVVLNSDEYADINVEKEGHVACLDKILSLKDKKI